MRFRLAMNDFWCVEGATIRFLTPSKWLRIMRQPNADVAELADAQVSEACDGDIVEVQVLSSAPEYSWRAC